MCDTRITARFKVSNNIYLRIKTVFSVRSVRYVSSVWSVFSVFSALSVLFVFSAAQVIFVFSKANPPPMSFSINEVLTTPLSPSEQEATPSVIDRLPIHGNPEATSEANTAHGSDFDYLDHYEKDAEVFDYFEAPPGPATIHENGRLHAAILRQVPGGVGSVLDIGCGNAWVADALTRADTSVISFDIASTNLKKALEKVPRGNHFAVRGDVLNLPFRDDSFDAIISSEVIEHVPHLKGYLANIIRVLKPGGRAIITTPYKEKIQYSLCIHCNRATPLHAHIHAFDEHSLDKLLAAHPNVKLSYFTQGNKALVHLQTHGLLRHLPFKAWKAVDGISNAIVNKPGRLIYLLDKAAD